MRRCIYDKFSSEKTQKAVFLMLLAGTGLYCAAYLWANFFCHHAYNLDMYADIQIARLMWREKSVFISHWIYGNQFCFGATPALAALIYGICADAVLAMSIATELMTAAFLLLFWWMIKPFTDRYAAAAGIFAVGGAVITGTSICCYNNGAQIMYTMASYYICYMIGIALVLGIYLRLRKGICVHPAVIAVALIYMFMLGAQSLRETLVLIIPLVIIDVAAYIFRFGEKQYRNRSSAFTAAVMVFNAAGLLAVKNVFVMRYKTTSDMHIPESFAELLENAENGLRCFAELLGLSYFENGIIYVPLAIIGLIHLLVCITALCFALSSAADAVKRKEAITGQDIMLIFAAVSVLGVFAVGMLLSFYLRAIYFFVWFMLAALSYMYIINKLKSSASKNLLALLLLGIGAVNLFYNVYPDAVQYEEQKRVYTQTAERLAEENIKYIYFDACPFNGSAIAACSGERLDSIPVLPRIDEQGNTYFVDFGKLTDIDMLTNIDAEHSVIVMSVVRLIGMSSFDNIGVQPGMEQNLAPELELMFVESGKYTDLYIYRILDASVIIEPQGLS